MSLLSKLGSSGECNHKRSHSHNRIADARFFMYHRNNPTGKAWIASLRVNVKTFTGKDTPASINLPTGPDHPAKKNTLPYFLVDLQKFLSGFIRGLGVPWLHTGNQQQLARVKKQAAGPTKDTDLVEIVQYRAKMKAGFPG